MADSKQVGPGLYVKLGLDYNGIIGGIGGVSLALNQTLDLFGKFEGMAQGFIDLANNAGRMGKEIKDNARDLGLSTTQYQQWTHAAIAAGSSAEEITGSIRMMSVRMKEASDPTSAMGKQLAALGVSVTDSKGNMRSMNDVLLDIFPALNALPPGFERNQASMEIFGRNFSNIADLASLSREEIQQLIDQAPVFSDEKINQLDAYNTQMALLNERMERSKALAGTEMISSFSTWGNMMDTALQKGQPLNVFFQDLNLALEMVAEGITLLGARIIAFNDLTNPTSKNFGNFGAFNKTISDADAAVTEMRRKFALAQSGYFEGAIWDTATNSWKKAESATKDYKNATDSATKSVSELGNASQAAAKSSASAWSDSSVVGNSNSEMYAFLMKEMNAGTAYQDALNAWASGAHTSKVNPIAGTLGAAKKDLTPGSTGQTDAVKTEYDAQGKALAALTKTTTDEYKKQSDAFKKCLDDMQAFREKQYPILETLDLTHFATFEETARVGQQKVLDNMAQLVNFAGTNPIIQNFIVMSKKGPDWTPAAFTQITAPTLASADFTQVGAAVQAIVAKGLGDGTSGSKAAQASSQKIEVIVKDKTSGGVKAQLASVNGGIGGRS